MDFDSLSYIRGAIAELSLPALILIGLLLACAVGGACVAIYTLICSAFDSLQKRRKERAERDAWFEQQARIHEASKKV
jgi:hypothetical protein